MKLTVCQKESLFIFPPLVTPLFPLPNSLAAQPPNPFPFAGCGCAQRAVSA